MVVEANHTVVTHLAVISFGLPEYFTSFAVSVVVKLCLLIDLGLHLNVVVCVENLLFVIVERYK